jgi:ATP-dependent helicase/nuclease subunit A
MTRARGAAQRSWWLRVAPFAAPWAPDAGSGAGGVAEPLPRVAVQAAPQRRAPGQRRAAADDAAAARLGQAVHRALEWLGQPGRAPAPVDEACAAAAAAFGADPSAVLATVRRVLASEACRRFFDPAQLRWAGNEVPFADAEGVLRLDRLVQLAGAAGPEWWVLDYKLASDPAALAAYAPQMARYLAAVRGAQPGEPVRGGFVTGQGTFVEFVPN